MADTTQPWTDAERIRLFQAKMDFTNYNIISRQLNRTPFACEKMWRSRGTWLGRLGLDDGSEKAARTETKEELVRKLSDTIDNKRETNKVRADLLADRLAECVQALPAAPPCLYKAPKTKKARSEEDVGLMLSDLHIGLKYTLEETGGLSEYSVAKYHERLDNLKKAVTEITELHQQLYKLPTLNLFLLGDNCHGMNSVGQWSAAYIEKSIMDQMVLGWKSIADFIYYMLGLYENVNIYAVYGNHGRVAEKGAEKDDVNWDSLLYMFLQQIFKDNPRVKIQSPKTWFILAEIRKHRFLVLHGDDVKGGNFPIQSLLKTEAKYMGLHGIAPHYTLAGHFHSSAEISTNHGRVYINGAFTGPDTYSLKALQMGGKAEQTMFGIHDVRGVTWKYNIDLDARRD